MLLPGFDIRKSAQAVAFLAIKAGGTINVLKLSKLVYLAEREFMARYDTPMFYDRLCSMPDGPVASITLNLINGSFEDATWSAFVSRRQGYDVSVAENVSFEKLDNLSKADVKVLNSLWEKFGQFDKYALRDWTHVKANVPEWIDPRGSSNPIYHEDVFRYLKKDNSLALAEDVEEYRRVHEYLDAAE
jgi:uncharacterized phage-associated protein